MPRLIAHFEADTLADLHAQIEAALYGSNRVPETLPVVTLPAANDPPAPPADSVVKTTVTQPAAPAAEPAPAAEKKPRGRPRKDQAAAPEAVADEKPAGDPPSDPPAQAVEVEKGPVPAPNPSTATPLSAEEQDTIRAKLRAEAARVQRLMGIGARTEILARVCGEDCLMVDEVPTDKLEATLEAFRAAA
jgi:hypothetical protein